MTLSSLDTRWTTTPIDGHECSVFEPPQPAREFCILYLHGVHLHPLRDYPEYTAECARQGLRVIGPYAGRCWWTDRICPDFDARWSAERYVVERVLPWIESQFNLRPPAIGLLGTSMGGQGALRLAYRYPHLFPVVAAVSPAIDFHQRLREGDEVLSAMYANSEDARQDTATLHVHPLNWPRHQFICCDPADHRWIESAERLHMKLASLGIPHEYDVETTGGGHGGEYYGRMALRAIEFLVERLERERLRVP